MLLGYKIGLEVEFHHGTLEAKGLREVQKRFRANCLALR